MRLMLLLPALAGLAVAGCGGGVGKVKGKLVENGQPKSFPTNTAAITFTPQPGPDGKPGRSFTAVVNPDGTFDVVASGGEFTPGNYEVLVETNMGGKGKKAVTTHREVKSGQNELTIDLAKPDV